MGRIRNDDDMHPETGTRFVLEFASESDSDATYNYKLFTPEEKLCGVLALGMDSDPSIVSSETPLSDEQSTMLLRIAKIASRNAKRAAQEQPVTWPRRLVRWRGPGR